MMCQRIVRFPMLPMGLGRYSVSSRKRVPLPPQRITTLRAEAMKSRLGWNTLKSSEGQADFPSAISCCIQTLRRYTVALKKPSNTRKRTMKSYNIAVLPGDGTGPEVIREGIKVVDAASSKFGFKVNWTP